MANTRDTLGDQATVDALVNRTLTNLEEDGVLSIGYRALYFNDAIESVNLPSCTSLGNASFYKCTALETVTLPKVTSIGSGAFSDCSNLEKVDCGESGGSAIDISTGTFTGCYKLKDLIIRSNAVAILHGNSSLDGTALRDGIGAVYVPTAMVSEYRADQYFNNFVIADINDYPVSTETIQDSWAEIKAAENNGTYLSKYSVGDTKIVYIDGVPYKVKIIGFDLDTAANSGDSAHITWMFSYCLIDKRQMKPSTSGSTDWDTSSMRSYLSTTVLPTLDISNYIVPVTKTYYDYATTSTKSSTDSLWIPSAREMFGGTSYEDSGCDYTNVFSDANSLRIKTSRDGGSGSWWLRTPYSKNKFYSVNSGAISNSSATSSLGVVIGFCT